MKALILSCNMGGGHNACANHIKSELRLNNIHADVVDYLSIIGKHASKTVEKIHMSTMIGNGTVFGGVYKLGELYNKTSIKSPVYLINALNKDKLLKYIKNNKYDLVICPHLYPSLAMTKIKEEYDIPLINIATDYTYIPFWNETKPDDFVIASDLVESEFINKGIPKEIIKPFGIPISTKFQTIHNTSHLPNDKGVILLTSGSIGFGSVEKFVDAILNNISDKYLVVICGSNKKLYSKLKTIKSKNLIVKGYIKNMNECINASTIVISKPGGITSSEVATLNKPMIHTLAIPGVEEYNEKFFVDNGLSLYAKDEVDVVEKLNMLLNDKNLCKKLIENQKKIINKNSAKDLVKYIIKKYSK